MPLSFMTRILAGDSKTAIQLYKPCSLKILSYLTQKFPHPEDIQKLTNGALEK